jgi:hypothetical protein
MKAYKLDRGIAPLIFNFGIRWRYAVKLIPLATLQLVKTDVRIIGGPQSRCGRFGEEKNFFLCQDKNPASSSL